MVKKTFQLLLLFGFFYVFEIHFQTIYEYHLGFVTNSDVLYPYLFAKDIWEGTIRGWNFPPSTCLFPDSLLNILLFPITKDVYRSFFLFGFYAFAITFFAARSLGLKNKNSLFLSLAFLLFAAELPDSLGQYVMPSFHISIFLFLAYFLYESKHWNSKKPFHWFRMTLVFTLLWLSEYWFFVHLGFFVVWIFWKQMGKQIWIPTLLMLIGFFITKSIQNYLRSLDIGMFTAKELPTIERIQTATNLIFNDPISFFTATWQSITQHPVLWPWFQTFLILFVMLFIYAIWFAKTEKPKNLIVLCLSPFITIFALKVFQIEPNFRYLYILAFLDLFLGLYFISKIPLLRRSFPIIAFIGFVVFSASKTHERLEYISTGEKKRKHRIQCLETFDPKEPASTTYWPTKYSYTFSKLPYTLVPYTKEGIYYPWVSNKHWDKGLGSKPMEFYSWGITETKEHLTLFPNVQLVKECEGLYFYKR
ncbi:hypothetical protein P3G55_01580 [Leptospira sp. 96542]|nr:hypothetical protein [Leptospira sp. 96542]